MTKIKAATETAIMEVSGVRGRADIGEAAGGKTACTARKVSDLTQLVIVGTRRKQDGFW